MVHHELYDTLYESGVWFEHIFPTQGSLIGYLRHGRLMGNLTDEKVDVVDLDLDLVTMVNNRTAGFDLCNNVYNILKQKYTGWLGCYWETTECACLKQFADLSTFWAGLRFLIPSTTNTNTDKIQTQMVEGSVWLDSFPVQGTQLIDWSDAGQHSTFEEYVKKHLKEVGTIGISASVMYPVKKCLGYDSVIACPNNPWQFLTGKHQDGDDFFKSCLATPYHGPTRNSHDPRNKRLLEKGITVDDLKLLQARWESFESRGVLSMLSVWNSNACKKERLSMSADISQSSDVDEESFDVPTSPEIGSNLREESPTERVEISYFSRAIEDAAYNSLCFDTRLQSAPFHESRLDRSEYCCTTSPTPPDCFDEDHSKAVCCQKNLHKCAEFIPRHFADYNVMTDDMFREVRQTVLAHYHLYQDNGGVPFESLVERQDLCPIFNHIENNAQDILNTCPEVLVLVLLVGSFVDICSGDRTAPDLQFQRRLTLDHVQTIIHINIINYHLTHTNYIYM